MSVQQLIAVESTILAPRTNSEVFLHKIYPVQNIKLKMIIGLNEVNSIHMFNDLYYTHE